MIKLTYSFFILMWRYISKHCSIFVICSQSNKFVSCLIHFSLPSYTKCHSSLWTTKQNKSLLLVKNNCGCLIVLASKICSQEHGFIQLVSFNSCIFISYSIVWPFIFNMLAILLIACQHSMFYGTWSRQLKNSSVLWDPVLT